MTILVIAEHTNAALAPVTLNTVAAAQKIGGDIHVLVAGANAGAAAEAAAKIAGVAKVLRRRIVMWVRSEPEEATSRWYVHGDDWQMTVSHKERDRALPPTDDDGPAYDDEDNQDSGNDVRRLVIAAPAGGIA